MMTFYPGLDEILVKDPQQNLTFPMWVMYPTDQTPKATRLGPYTVNAALGAPAADAGSFPLVIISHGTGGTPLVYRDLAAFLAQNGFVVGLPEHPFNNRNNNEREGTLENLIDRPRHLSLCIDCLFANPRWHLREDVALIGHSWGLTQPWLWRAECLIPSTRWLTIRLVKSRARKQFP